MSCESVLIPMDYLIMLSAEFDNNKWKMYQIK